MWRRQAVSSSASSCSTNTGIRCSRVEALVSRVAEALQNVWMAPCQTPQLQSLEGNAQTCAAILGSQSMADRPWQDVLSSQIGTAALEEGLVMLETPVPDVMEFREAAVVPQGTRSPPRALAGGDQGVSAVVVAYEIALPPTERGQSTCEPSDAPEDSHAVEVAGPMIFDMAVPDSSHTTLCGADGAQQADALDNWLAGVRADDLTLEVAEGISSTAAVAGVVSLGDSGNNRGLNAKDQWWLVGVDGFLPEAAVDALRH